MPPGTARQGFGAHARGRLDRRAPVRHARALRAPACDQRRHRQRQHALLPRPRRRLRGRPAARSGRRLRPAGRRPHHHALRRPRRAERQQRRPHRRDDGQRQDRAAPTSWRCAPRATGSPSTARRSRGPDRVRRPRHQRLRHARPPDVDGRDLRQHRQRQHGAPRRAAGVPGALRRRAGRRERRHRRRRPGRGHPARQRRRPARLLPRRPERRRERLRPPSPTSTSASR